MKLGGRSLDEGTSHGSRRALERRSIASGVAPLQREISGPCGVRACRSSQETIGQFPAWLHARHFSPIQLNNASDQSDQLQPDNLRNPANNQPPAKTGKRRTKYIVKVPRKKTDISGFYSRIANHGPSTLNQSRLW